MGEPDPDDLDARLARVQAERGRVGPARLDDNKDKIGGAGLGFRVGVDIVAALAVGVGIGWLLDSWLGTKPWGMVAFFFLGAAAGVMNVYRAIKGMGYAVGYRTPPKDDDAA